jgi:putative cell wall-binding protein
LKLKKYLSILCLVVCFTLSFTIKTYASLKIDRLAGDDRYKTAVEISKAGWKSADNIVLATGENFPDALCAAPLAKQLNAPILLTGKASFDSNTESEIKRLEAKNVFIIGGTGVISDDIKAKLESMGLKVKRLYGQDRYETAINVASYTGVSFGKEIAVAIGDDFPDALSISPIAAQKGMPIILVPKDNLPESVKSYISSKEITKTYIIGGSDIISDSVVNEFPAFERIDGNDKYLRNIAVLIKFQGDIKLDKVYLATGENYPDALAGSALAQVTSSPIILINSTPQQSIISLITANLSNILSNVKEIKVLGGEGAVPSSILQALLPGSVNP